MFSVIIPLYNKSASIKRAIESVLNQTFQEFELIVVNDGSTDNSAAIVAEFQDSRIHLIHQQNGGVSKARNTGIANARNKYLTFLDADDEYLPECLQTFQKLIAAYPAASIWSCSYYCSKPNGELYLPDIKGIARGYEGELEDYFAIAANSTPPICTGTACIRVGALLKYGGFPEGITSGEDLLTWPVSVPITNRCIAQSQ